MSEAGTESLLEFPCAFPIKMMGRDSDAFRRAAISLVEEHVGVLDEKAIATAKSRNGKFLSITVTIDARSRKQLDDVYRALTAHEEILVVL